MPAPTADRPVSLLRLKVVGLVIFAVMLVADLASKSYMQDLLDLRSDVMQGTKRIELIPGFLAFEGTWNPGVTFGLAPDKTILILTLTCIATLALLIWFIGSRSRSRLLHIGLALILSGAIGNLYDRIQWHKVRDFILMYLDVGGDELKWPNYNVADACIVVGVILIIWDSLFGLGAKEAKQRAEARDAEKKRRAEQKKLEEDRRSAEGL